MTLIRLARVTIIHRPEMLSLRLVHKDSGSSLINVVSFISFSRYFVTSIEVARAIILGCYC